MARRNRLIRNFKKLDLFGTNITFREDGGDQFGSVFGALISLLVAMVVAEYGLNKFFVLKERNDTNFNDFSEK